MTKLKKYLTKRGFPNLAEILEPTKECFNGDGLHPKKSPKKDFIEDKIKEFEKEFPFSGEDFKYSKYFLTSSLNEAWDKGREECYDELYEIINSS